MPSIHWDRWALQVAGSLLGLITAGVALAATITVHPLERPPVLDGNGGDWAEVPGTVISLQKSKPEATTPTRAVLVKGGVHGEHVSFYFEWEDATQDLLHKPWVWDPAKKKYVKGPQREDRLAVQFSTGGDYTTDWFAGKNFTADMWHWKASRSEPLGLAHDKSTTVSEHRQLRAYKGTSRQGQPVYIARPSDNGDKLYRTKRYHQYQREVMPKYHLNDAARGSVADVEARGVWADGKWHLELRRKLDTGHSDDVVFTVGQSIVGGLAVFDHSENDDHAISDTLTFQF